MSLENCPHCGAPWKDHMTGGCPKQVPLTVTPEQYVAVITKLRARILELEARPSVEALTQAMREACEGAGMHGPYRPLYKSCARTALRVMKGEP